jgi:hypothetical protein
VRHASFPINDLGLLQDFDVWEIQTFQQSILPEYFLRESRIVHHTSFSFDGGDPCRATVYSAFLSPHFRSTRSGNVCPSQIEGYKSLRLFGLREFQPLHTLFLPKCFHPKAMICRRMSPTDRRLQITSGLHASTNSKVLTNTNL